MDEERKARKARKARKDELDIEDILTDLEGLLAGGELPPIAPEPEPEPVHPFLELLGFEPVLDDDGDGLGNPDTHDELMNKIPLSVVRAVMPLSVRQSIIKMPIWHLMMAFTRADAMASCDDAPGVQVTNPIIRISSLCSMAFTAYVLYTRYPVQYAQWNGTGTPLQYFWGLE